MTHTKGRSRADEIIELIDRALAQAEALEEQNVAAREAGLDMVWSPADQRELVSARS